MGNVETVGELLRRGKAALQRAGVPDPGVDVEWLVAFVLKVKRLELVLHRNRRLSDEEQRRVDEFLQQRCRRIPLQHLLGTVPFLNCDLKVTPAALIPRPETECLAQIAIQHLRSLSEKGVLRALDVGTGSGCLAVAMAKAIERLRVWGVDLSGEALALAQENVDRNGVRGRVELRESDLFERVPPQRCFDLVVSNPPYIPRSVVDGLQDEVRRHEPVMALVGGEDGLEFYRRLADRARGHLKSGRLICLEIGDGQEDAVEAIFSAKQWRPGARHPDGAGTIRVLEFIRGG